jgi:large subunit ribosomal protein L4
VKQLARRSALSYKAQEKAIMVVEGLKMDAPKTKDFAGLMKGLDLSNNKTLMVLPAANDNVYMSSRNLPKHRVMVATDLSTYDIMNCNTLILVDDAHKVIEGMLK